MLGYLNLELAGARISIQWLLPPLLLAGVEQPPSVLVCLGAFGQAGQPMLGVKELQIFLVFYTLSIQLPIGEYAYGMVLQQGVDYESVATYRKDSLAGCPI